MQVTQLTAEVAGHVLYQYGVGGQEGGSFTEALLSAFMRADNENFARLATAYPAYGAAMDMAKNTAGGIDVLAAIFEKG